MSVECSFPYEELALGHHHALDICVLMSHVSTHDRLLVIESASQLKPKQAYLN